MPMAGLTYLIIRLRRVAESQIRSQADNSLWIIIDSWSMDLSVAISQAQYTINWFKHTAWGLCRTTSPASYAEASQRRLCCLAKSDGNSDSNPVAIMFELNAERASSSVKPALLAFVVNSSSILSPTESPRYELATWKIKLEERV